MDTTAILLILLLLVPVVATLWTTAHDGHGHPPRSHERDPRFRPPADLLD